MYGSWAEVNGSVPRASSALLFSLNTYISSVGPVHYYWPHESHAALMVSDLNKSDNWQGSEDGKDVEGCERIMSYFKPKSRSDSATYYE